MSERRQVTALVVGAGPAGAVTAAALARAGVETLLIDREDSDGPGYGLLLGAGVQENLRSLGVVDWQLTECPAELWFDAENRHVLPEAGYSLVDSAWFRKRLCAHALAEGVEFMRGTASRPVPGDNGFRVTIDGNTVVDATHVVLATGAAGQEVPLTGLTCARKFTGPWTSGRVLLRLIAPPATDPRGHPRYAWLVPGEDGDFTVGGMTLANTVEGPESLSDKAFAALVEVEPALADSRPGGPVVSAPAYCGFSPDRAASVEGLLVGDAAGLVNPFTGEGLGNAIQAGMLAAQAISAYPDDPEAASRTYAGQLGSVFVGYFETARHAARRYHLAWRVLASSAGSENAFYAKGRRAILLSASQAELAVAEPVKLPKEVATVLGPFLAGADEVAVSTVRREWPFLARLFTSAGGGHEFRLRPAMLVFGGILAGGRGPQRGEPTVAAALDLAMLGTLAFLGPPAVPKERRGVDWESATTVLAGDYLLGQASRLIAESAPGISWAFADWLGELASIRAESLVSGDLTGAEQVSASLFEFPARIGAELAGAPDEMTTALRTFGVELGRMFLYAEDVLALRGERTRLDTTLPAMLGGRGSSLPRLLDQPDLTAAAFAEPGLTEAAVAAATGAGQRSWQAIQEIQLPRRAGFVLRALAESVGAPLLR